MKKWIVTMLIVALAIVPVFALADSTLRVQGSASLSVAPDMAALSIGFSAESTDSSAAQKQTADAIAAIVEAIKGQGIEDADISTAYLNTYPVYNYADGGQTLRGYRVEHMLSVKVRVLDQAGTVLDAALLAGANLAEGITYQSSREKEVYLQALAQAVEDATAKADALAIATGVWLGSLAQINETNSYSTYRASGYAMAAEADTGASLGSGLMAGDLTITAAVELVYDIR